MTSYVCRPKVEKKGQEKQGFVKEKKREESPEFRVEISFSKEIYHGAWPRVTLEEGGNWKVNKKLRHS